jgi:cation diffusion facilitator family transporter
VIVREKYELPEDKQKVLKKAAVLEWLTIFFLITITIVMYLTMGSSQAMKTAWIEDVLSLIPPILFLISLRVVRNEPNADFPYGYQRVVTGAFIGASTALTILGLYLLYDALRKLIMAEHPTIGMMEIFGWKLWMGWVMIAALVYSVIPPIILGRMKVKPAEELHDKTLHADGEMNKADWMTAVAAIAGILGIGFGFWWGDSVAAGLISLSILKDGVENMKGSIGDLMDQRPTTVNREKPMHLEEKLRGVLKELDWVADADVRLRGEGHVIAGEAYVVPREEEGLLKRVREAQDAMKNADWRVYEVVVQPVERLENRADDE